MIETLIQMDGNLLLWIQNNLRNDVLTPVFVLITTLGNAGMIWIAITILLLARNRTRTVGYLSTVSLVGSFLIDNVLLKNLIARTRPYEVIDGLTSLVGIQSDFSFPSGHTGTSFAVAVLLWLALPRKYGIPAMILAVFIGISRLYVGVHYPSDVLGGAVIGTAIAILVWKIPNHSTNPITN